MIIKSIGFLKRYLRLIIKKKSNLLKRKKIVALFLQPFFSSEENAVLKPDWGGGAKPIF